MIRVPFLGWKTGRGVGPYFKVAGPEGKPITVIGAESF